jgi:hypothetical protein
MVVLRYLYVVALIVWVGGLVVAGVVVAPVVFAVLQADGGAAGRVLAGATFGEILRRVLLIGEAAGGSMLVVMTVLRLLGPKPLNYGIRALLLLTMLGTTAFTAHVVLPEADALRREANASFASLDAADPRRVRFDLLHQRATMLVTAVAVAGLVLAAWEARE